MTRRAHPSHPLDGILASPCPPPVVFHHHPYHSPADAWPSWNADGNACVVRVDAAKHSSARSVYTALVREAWRVVSAFTGIQDGREKGQHAGWDGRDVVHLDGLVRGLRRICASVALAGGPQTLEQNGASGKSKEVESNTTGPARSLVLAIHHAEQLHRAAGSGWGVLTRLPDIVRGVAADSEAPLAHRPSLPSARQRTRARAPPRTPEHRPHVGDAVGSRPACDVGRGRAVPRLPRPAK